MSTDYSSTASTVVQTGVSATAVAFFHDSIIAMIPYLICCIPLVLLDLDWGVKAARHREEKVTFSKAFRQTVNKLAEYICWVILAATASLAFHHDWIEWVVLAAVFCNEIISIVGNYLETKGIELSFVTLYRWVFRKGIEKVGGSIDELEVSEIIKEKPKPARKAKGQFVKKGEQ